MRDEQAVLAPNATIVNNLPSDPPVVDAEFERKEDGSGYLIVRDGYSVEVIDPASEGQPTHTFASIEALAGYLLRNHNVDSQIDILVEENRVFVYVDPYAENPQVLTCILPFHPCFAAWLEQVGIDLSQKRFIQHCRGWRESLVDPDTLLGALGNITVIGKSNFTSSMDETGAMRLVSADDSKDLSVKIPPTVSFATPIYEEIHTPDGEEEFVYRCELLLSVDTDAPVSFMLAFPKQSLIVSKARRDAASYLGSLLGDSFHVSVGVAGHNVRLSTPSNRI